MENSEEIADSTKPLHWKLDQEALRQRLLAAIESLPPDYKDHLLRRES